MDLTNQYQIIDGTPEGLCRLMKDLRKLHIPYKVVKLRYTTGDLRGGSAPAVKISQAAYRELFGGAQ